jgi:hypothetical protein
LDAELASLGVSPHPRVVVLVEGKTERLHIQALAQEYGIHRPQFMRVLDVGGSRVRPDLVARYVATPRLAANNEGAEFELDALPTAVIIAMDPENLWATEGARADRLRIIHDAVRAAVDEQGGQISQPDLDFLVEVRTWGDHTYELGNFTDDELADALTALAAEAGLPAPDRSVVLAEVASQREHRRDISVALGRLRLPDDKVRLAELLTPALIRAEGESAPRPVIQLVEAAHQKVVTLLSGTFVLSSEPP